MDYRGEIGIILTNISSNILVVRKGDKVAQGIIKEYIKAVFSITSGKLPITSRGIGGFGSTDVKNYLLPKEHNEKYNSSNLIN